MRSFLCLQRFVTAVQTRNAPKTDREFFLDATLTAVVGTTVSIGHTFVHLKSVGFSSYMALLQITAADLNNVMPSDLHSTACFEASKTIRPVDSEMKHSV